jgi:hypothetical protein
MEFEMVAFLKFFKSSSSLNLPHRQYVLIDTVVPVLWIRVQIQIRRIIN